MRSTGKKSNRAQVNSQLDECSDAIDAHLNGFAAVQDVGCRDRAMLGEHEGATATAALQSQFPTIEKEDIMAKLVFGLNQSLDGYVDHTQFSPPPALFRHFIEQVRGLSGLVYGRRTYEVMRYWDDDRNVESAEEHDFAAAWRSQPKWVVSRSLQLVGPNATLLGDDFKAAIGGLKAQLAGEIDVAGPELAHSLTDLGLIDEYRLYLHPVVLGHGKPFFAGPRPPLRLAASDRICGDVLRLTYVPA